MVSSVTEVVRDSVLNGLAGGVYCMTIPIEKAVN
jgi:hypothetical protein